MKLIQIDGLNETGNHDKVHTIPELKNLAQDADQKLQIEAAVEETT